jgi:hypothetical protein
VSPTRLPSSSIPGLRTIEITSESEQELQRFFEANPPNEAHEEIHGELPLGWSFTRKWLVGYVKCRRFLGGISERRHRSARSECLAHRPLHRCNFTAWNRRR